MIFGAVLLSLLAGCAESVETPPPPPQFPKWQPKQPRPADRDEEAVDTALATLDLCELIDLAVYDRRKGGDTRPVERRTEVKRDRKQCSLFRGGYDLISVRDMDPSHLVLHRVDGAVIDLGGVKGYQTETRRMGGLDGCEITVPVSFERAITFEVGRASRSKDCGLLRDFATAGAAKLPRDLVYPPEGQDSARVGACADWGATEKGETCDPAVEVEVPTGAEKILAAGAADPNLECAVFRDAVKMAFGADFAPIATPGEWHADPNKTYKDHQLITFGESPGVTFRTQDDREFALYAAPLGNIDVRGHVRLRVVPEHERGSKDWDRRQVVSDLDVGNALAVMDFVMATHFRGPR
ncbi:hypothetical protein [Amycolatopsis keratiniphila]|uniref:Uncharacterized protein n=1 Tax=Amycolatopsis keratiniphila TaxID=129921 RepID=R4SWJ6_9PSEU|nr:hypothetical protein [Amycolatopsis keratiniphila]AGM03127.1 hypothetical protein AORI_0538 [Amycolatopsis keratiniphila]